MEGGKEAFIWDAAEVRILHRLAHNDVINYLCADPSGRRIATCSKDASAKVWDSESGRQLGPDLRHKDGVGYAAFSPDGSYLATTGFDATVRLWQLDNAGATSKYEFDIGSPGDFVGFSPDSQFVAATDNRCSTYVWNIATAEKVLETEAIRESTQFNNPWAVYPFPRFSADGATSVAVGPDANTACVWDFRQGKELDRVHTDRLINRIELIGDDGDELAFTKSGAVELVRRSTESRRKLDYAGRISYLIGLNRGGTQLFTTSTRGYLHSWDTKSLEPLAPVLKHGQQISSMQVGKSGLDHSGGSLDGTARIWNFDVNRGFKEYAFDCGSAYNLSTANRAVSANGRYVVKLAGKDRITIARRDTGKDVADPIKTVGPVRQLGFVTNDRVFTLAENQLQFWRSDDGQADGGPYDLIPNVRRIVFSRTGQWLTAFTEAGSYFDATVYRSDTNPSIVRTYPVRYERSSFTPDEQSIALCLYDGVVSVRHLADDVEATVCVGQRGQPDDPWFSSDGKLMLTMSTDQFVRIWNVETGKLECPPLPHKFVRFAAFRPDGKAVVTVDKNCDALIWDTQTGDPVVSRIRPRFFNATRAWFSADGKSLVLADDQGKAVRWELPTVRGSVEHVAALARLLSGQSVDLERGVDFVEPSEFIENRTEYYQAWLDTRGKYVPDTYAAFPTIEAHIDPSIAELRQSIGRDREVTFTVKSTGGDTTIFLNSLGNWLNSDNFSAALAPEAVEEFRKKGIGNPRTELIGKRVRCRGTLALYRGRVNIYVRDVAKQFEVLDAADPQEVAGAIQDEQTERAAAEIPEKRSSNTVEITPTIDEIRASMGHEQTVTFRVALTGGRSHVYLNSLKDFQKPECFTVRIEPEAVDDLKEMGLQDPRKEFVGKLVECRGTVTLDGKRPQIIVTDVQDPTTNRPRAG